MASKRKFGELEDGGAGASSAASAGAAAEVTKAARIVAPTILAAETAKYVEARDQTEVLSNYFPFLVEAWAWNPAQ